MPKNGKAQKKDAKPKGEQLALIDVAPENAKPIIELARQHKEVMTTRLANLKEEVRLKQLVLEEVNKANLQRLPDGDIRFEYDSFLFVVTPCDDKIRITEIKAQA